MLHNCGTKKIIFIKKEKSCAQSCPIKDMYIIATHQLHKIIRDLLQSLFACTAVNILYLLAECVPNEDGQY